MFKGRVLRKMFLPNETRSRRRLEKLHEELYDLYCSLNGLWCIKRRRMR
jgi:hypothetical protein